MYSSCFIICGDLSKFLWMIKSNTKFLIIYVNYITYLYLLSIINALQLCTWLSKYFDLSVTDESYLDCAIKVRRLVSTFNFVETSMIRSILKFSGFQI